jgi:hypothetical protein
LSTPQSLPAFGHRLVSVPDARCAPAYRSRVSTTGLLWETRIDAGQERECALGSLRIDHRLVHVKRQRFDALGENLHRFGELSILLKHLHEEGRLVRRKRRPFLARAVQSLTMFRIGERMSRVAVGLAGLRQQDEWSRICRLQAEGEVEEDEWIDVEFCKPEDIDENPHRNNEGLGDEKARRAKKASERFSLSKSGAPVPAQRDLPSTIRHAIRAARKIRIAYQDGDRRSTERVIQPFAVAYYTGATLICARCELRNDLRHFHTDRVVSADVLDESFSIPETVIAKWLAEHQDD